MTTIFFENLKKVIFTHSIMPLITVQFQKNLTNRFRRKFKDVDFGPKNDTFTILGIKKLSLSIQNNHF